MHSRISLHIHVLNNYSSHSNNINNSLRLKGQVNEKSCRFRMDAYRDGVKRKGDKIINSHIVCMCIITIKWSQNCSTSWEERFRTSSLLCVYNYVTIIVPSQSYLLSFLHHPYMRPFSIFNTFHLLVDVLSYDSSFSSPHPIEHP